ncbi:MAG: tRNA lysidine(34) synthetase TilS [Steroidobacteraceae bacterium]
MTRGAGAATADAARRCEHFDPDWLGARLRVLEAAAPGQRLCVAYSGGVDSSALLHALVALRRRRRLALRALHVDHGLQPDAGAWARAAAAQARRWRVALEVLPVRVAAGGSLEAAARAARYAALAARLEPGELLLTAHNQDDQLETVLLQLVRGAGIAGLAAMPARAPFAAGTLLRPLLPVPRALLRAYLERSGVAWSEDPSNADERFDRSYLRQRVVPLLRSRWPAVAVTVSRSARHAAEAQQLLAAATARTLDAALDGAALRLSALRRLGPAARRALLRQWFAERGCPAPDQRRLEELARGVLQARGDAQPLLRWGGHELRRHGDRLHLGALRTPPPRAPLQWRWRSRRRWRCPAAPRCGCAPTRTASSRSAACRRASSCVSASAASACRRPSAGARSRTCCSSSGCRRGCVRTCRWCTRSRASLRFRACGSRPTAPRARAMRGARAWSGCRRRRMRTAIEAAGAFCYPVGPS